MGRPKIYTETERLERDRLSKRAYVQREKAKGPEFLQKIAARQRARHQRMKHDPEYQARYRTHSLKRYYTKIRPNPKARAKFRERAATSQRKRRAKGQEIKIKLQALLGGKCVSCGITDHRLLDFDHIDPVTKTMLISQSLHRSYELLLEEIKKCQLLCPNCHRLRTLEQGGFNAYKHREFRNEFRTPFRPLV